MTYEHYGELASTPLPAQLHGGLARIRLADHCAVVFAEAERGRAKAKERQDREQERAQQRKRDGARNLYTKGTNDKTAGTWPIERLCLPDALALDETPPVVSRRWMSLTIDFTLASPWYSRDDRPFHVLDNPVRKERVFGVPFMSSASWKGLLRWACRMEAGLLGHLQSHGTLRGLANPSDGWRDPDWIVHLFGNERGEGEEFSRGVLQFFPSWFDRIGFEVINPHSRETKAGTQPIVYEVVPAGTHGRLFLLYAPMPGQEGPSEAMPNLALAIEKLLTVYGFSAKRTAGWGLANIDRCEALVVKGSSLGPIIGANECAGYVEPSEGFKKLLDEVGRPIDVLLLDGRLISLTSFRKLGDRKPCTKDEFECFGQWYKTCGEEYRRRLKGGADHAAPTVLKCEFGSLGELIAALKEAGSLRKGGDP